MLRDPFSESSVLYLYPFHLSFPNGTNTPLSGDVSFPPPSFQLIPGPWIHHGALNLRSPLVEVAGTYCWGNIAFLGI